jgi:hypothetical protein
MRFPRYRLRAIEERVAAGYLRRMKRKIVTQVGFIALFFLVSTLSVFAFGSKEKDRDEGDRAVEAIPSGPLSGEVVRVSTQDDGDAELLVRQPNGAEVIVEIPSALARSIRVQPGDTIRTEEVQMAREGERLRVQRFEIDR